MIFVLNFYRNLIPERGSLKWAGGIMENALSALKSNLIQHTAHYNVSVHAVIL
jgi:hypothetical protein